MAESLIATMLGAELLATFEDPEYRPPPLPSVALELMALSGRDDANAEHVVRLLEQDEMLAGGVIRLVGSPIYAARTPVRSLKDAVIRLGFRTVRDVVFETALSQGVFSLPEYRETVEQIRRHSTVTAYLARLVCQHTHVDGEHAFLCALLHDIGFAGLLFAVSHIEKERTPALLQIWSELDRVHEQASKTVTELWGLPASIHEVVAHHHHLHTGPSSKVVAAICVADQLSERFAASVVGPVNEAGELVPGDRVSDLDFEMSREALGLDDGALGRILADAEALVPDILWL
ncbi:MAG TPA: HDOD domain-containing protein [Polyangiaceae bacterium]|jgi:HD-like signal output (HDOD) protein